MNKSELAKQIAERMNISHSDSLRYLDTSGKRMLEKLNPTLRAIVCLLFLPFLTGCSDEQQPASGEWIPVEINVAGIEQIEISSMGTKAWDTEQPSIVKTAFTEGDELKVTIVVNASTSTIITVIKQKDGSWKKEDGNPLKLPAFPDSSPPTIFIEYGTEISDNPGFSEADYLLARDMILHYNSNTKTYTCSCNFYRPEDYSCLYVKFTVVDPPDLDLSGNDHYYTYATFFERSDNTKTPKFPVSYDNDGNNILQVFYRGLDEFRVYGGEFEWNKEFTDFDQTTYIKRFDGEFGENDYYAHPTFTLAPGKITSVHLVVPWYYLEYL